MILPEYVGKLRELKREDNQIVRLELEDWELELITDEIDRAYKNEITIKLTYWRDVYIKDVYGKVIVIDNKSKSIVIDDLFRTTRYPFSEIIAVTLIY